jgi:hypothetical protein
MSSTFVIEKGRVVKVNGLPYECLDDVRVSGWREPEWPDAVSEPSSGSANDPVQPAVLRSVATDGSGELHV